MFFNINSLLHGIYHGCYEIYGWLFDEGLVFGSVLSSLCLENMSICGVWSPYKSKTLSYSHIHLGGDVGVEGGTGWISKQLCTMAGSGNCNSQEAMQ